ncbi:MAG: UDP-N-acetylmuramyl-tripeptide synthetase [Patescibacteria group bacterium]|jgi:UDP-N-acetylmuramoyl-L-alanyl-D-glutamate--2,6-diaminopimelate ligase|nr:UDP-N-acetylmuramyl-tripeptide synthetase [Patescibacteria group bacterium]
MKNIKNHIKKLMPKAMLDNFHYPEAKYYSRKKHYPAEKMIVIGIVGSKGKTTTANMLWSVLTSGGHKVGQVSTANIRIGEKEQLNKWHMTMPGSKKLQSLLKEMYMAKCDVVIMEVPSEAQTQWRHIGINFDILIFTGVEKEIMAAHRNSMEILHKHNLRVFKYTSKNSKKILGGKIIPKTLIYNADSKHYKMYTSENFDHKISFSVHAKSDYQATNISSAADGTRFRVNGEEYKLNLIGDINAKNAASAIATAKTLGVKTKSIQKGLSNLQTIPGRMEPIDEGQDFMVFVDYAHDQVSLELLLETGRKLVSKNNKMIVLFGGQGGGRDKLKRSEMGSIAGRLADIVVISDDDPYDDDPMEIIEDIAVGAKKAGKTLDNDLFLVQDRRNGIRKVLELAKKDDLVFVACKGADQLMMIANGKSLAWDDRKVTREELKKLIKH